MLLLVTPVDDQRRPDHRHPHAAGARAVRDSSPVAHERDAAAVQTLVDDIHGRHGRIDWMFNNAGIAIGGHRIARSVTSQ